jgi:hypothetical protein
MSILYSFGDFLRRRHIGFLPTFILLCCGVYCRRVKAERRVVTAGINILASQKKPGRSIPISALHVQKKNKWQIRSKTFSPGAVCRYICIKGFVS